MPEAVLQEYSQEISRLIEDSHLGEAVRHCRHILEQFPRHVETYRLMGKALLEQGELEGAADVFQRVLSADPEDFIAHAGMAIIYKQQNKLPEAAWHMERAFEVDPYNGVIREALQDIIGLRDGLPPEHLTLTRGALARLYLKGELYSQVIGDLKQLLDEDPDRVDLAIVLAEALWRDGQRVEAAEVCTRVLERLPDCTKANAILAEVWLVTDRVDEAQNYLRTVFELVLPSISSLDVDSVVGHAFSTDGSPLLPEAILVNRAGSDVSAGSSDELVDWVQDLDFGDEFALEDVEPEWLGALQDDSNVLPVEEDDSSADRVRGIAAHGLQDADIGLPADWSEGDPFDAAESSAEQEASSFPELKGELKDQDPVPPETQGETAAEATSWFSQSSDQLPGIGELGEETDWESWLSSEREHKTPAEPGSRGDSLDVEEVRMGAMDDPRKNQDEFSEAEEPRRSGEGQSGQEGDSFDWLDELQEASEPTQSDELKGMDEGALPDWLRDGIDMNDASEADLDWMDDSEADKESRTTDPVAGSREDLPDWLREELAVEGEEEPLGTGDDLSWLDQIAAGEGPAIEEPPTMSWPESEISGPEGTDVEASDFEAVDDVPEDLEEAMAWLEQLASQQGAPLEELPSLAPSSDKDALTDKDEEELLAEVPDDISDAMAWLDELSDEQIADREAEPASTAFEDIEEAAEEEEDGELHWLDELASVDSESDFGSEMIGEAAESDQPVDVGAGGDWFDEIEDEAFDAPAMADDQDGFELQAGIGREELDLESKLPAAEQPPAASAEHPEQHDLDWLDEVDEDSDLDAAWLEELTRDAGADRESAEFSGDQVGDEHDLEEERTRETDEAMAWLEELAAEGSSTTDMPSWQGLDRDEPGLEALTELEDIPDDPEQALAWLEGLAADADETQIAIDVVEEEATPAVPHDVVAARAEAEAILLHDEHDTSDVAQDAEILEAMPEDPDEAMVWLEKLAARQGESLDELPSVTDVDDEIETPDWLSEELEAEGIEEDEAFGLLFSEDTVDEADWEEPDLAVTELEPEIPEAEVAVEGTDVTDDEATDADLGTEFLSEMAAADMEVDEDLPDWLALDNEDEEDQFDWDEPAFDPTGWLRAEELAAEESGLQEQAPELEFPEEGVAESEYEEVKLEEFEDTSEGPPGATEPAIPELEDITDSEREEGVVLDVEDAEELALPEIAEPLTPETEAAEGDRAEQFQKAWTALETEQYDVALETYGSILERGDNISLLISDLERATEAHDSQPRLVRLLGDAYMENGQLQKALDAYRKALEML